MSLDTLGREAAQRAHAAVDRCEPPTASSVLDRRRRAHRTRTGVAGAAALLVMATGTFAVVHDTTGSSRSRHVDVSTIPLPKGDLQFRAIEYAGDSPQVFASAAPDCTTPKPGAAAVFFDREHKSCYDVGPVLVTGASVSSVDVLYDSTQSQWSVNVKWNDNEFNTKVAGPLVNKEVAIVLNDIVESAPTINPGITGPSVEITGDFTRAKAVNLGASIMGIAPDAVPVH